MNTNTITKNKGRPRQFDREQALNQALCLFWQQGYAQTSISDLCSSMNINPPSLYAAFGNKKALFRIVLAHYMRHYWDGVWAKIDVHHDISEAVVQFFQAAVAVMRLPNMPKGCMMLSQVVQIQDEEIQASLREVREQCMMRFRHRIQRAIMDKQLKSDTDVELLATLLHVYLEGLSFYAHNTDGEMLVQIAQHAVDLLKPFQAA